jgi:glycosyltransferase A (GT-A) superfamily protein (DUF2064 family)
MTRALVVAKAPVAGLVKTRLGAEVGMVRAADLAAAALLDTIAACADAFGVEGCLLALTGDLGEAERGAELGRALDGWRVFPQRGSTFAERLAHAHADVPTGGPVLQVGMDTPQLTASHLHDAAKSMAEAEAVLGPAEDGGWWLLGLHRPAAAAALRAVPMSTPTTYADTRQALTDAGLGVATTALLRDVDTSADAAAVARTVPDSEFGRAWVGIAA